MSRPTKEDQPDHARLSTRDLENDSRYSTWSGRNPEKARRKYVSVDHALNWLTHFWEASAIDVASLAIPSSSAPSADDFIVEQCQLAELAEAFNEALRESGAFRARVWAAVRLHNATHRSFDDISKDKVGRIVGEVDGAIAQALKDRYMWRSGEVRPQEHAVEPRHGKEQMA
ncbi:MAG: hypothetical protein ABEN55_21645 [Bradymonadaceae bacterium]